jgi:hypothetical protein
MSETPPQPNGAVRWRPVLPVTMVIIAVVVAVGAVTGLIFLLYEETRGPGEILRRFATAVDEGDCPGSYELLDDSVRARFDEDAWCSMLPEVDGLIDADFDLRRSVLEEDVAIVTISGTGVEVWRLKRFGDRSWRVLGPEDGSFETPPP